jgi:hypothetical protein
MSLLRRFLAVQAMALAAVALAAPAFALAQVPFVPPAAPPAGHLARHVTVVSHDGSPLWAFAVVAVAVAALTAGAMLTALRYRRHAGTAFT